MRVIEIINKALEERATRFTFELLPPLKGAGAEGIFTSIDPLMEFDPAYINITSHREEMIDGRLVRRRPGTVGISAAIMKRYGVEAVPHIICGGISRYDIENELIDMDFLGLRNVLALRGDSLRGQPRFVPHPDGHAHAVDLVRQIDDMNSGRFIDGQVEECRHSRFCIGVAGYPETHSEAGDPGSDIRHLKAKVDAGASYIVTQMCFDTGKILSFIERCRLSGITVPIIPGIKPLTTAQQVDLLPRIFSVGFPADFAAALSQCRTAVEIRETGIDWAVAQALELKRAAVPAIHFYTMGRSDTMTRIARRVF